MTAVRVQVLVVDDNLPELLAITRILSKAGLDVAQASSGLDALRLARELRPRLVLLDVMLPDISGLEVLRSIRADPDLGSTSVVMLSSALTAPENKAGGIDAGADDYISRPIANSELLARVRMHLRTIELKEALRVSEARFRDLIADQADAVLVVDREGIIQFANRRAALLFNREAEALLESPFGYPIGDGSAQEISIHHPDTGQVIAEMRVATTFWDGRAATIATLRDISERKRVEEALASSEQNQWQVQAQLQLLETCVSRLNDIVLITEAEPFDEPGPRIVFVNEAFERRTGYSRAEVLGKSPRILQGPGTQRSELDRIRSALQKWQPVRAELLNYTKSGEEFWLELDIVPVADAKGWYTHWVAVERDVTERRNLEARLHQSQRLEAVGQLTGGLAHDFNNLLTVILGNSELLSEELAGDARLGPLARMVTESALRGAELTHRLLAFARRQPLAPKTVDVNELIGGMDGLLRRTLGEHVEIGFVRRPGLAASLVDPAQLESALLNLCINSRDAMPEGGRLTIETSSVLLDEDYAARNVDVQPGEYVMVAVSDTGGGIAAQDLPRVFEPFYTTKPTGKGTGLGLSMVYGFVKQSRGHVSIYSEPAKGTTVRMYLPRTGMAGEAQQPQVETNIHGGAETILLVEDDELVRQYAGSQLRSLGYTVIEAVNGAQALKIIEQPTSIDLLFTDVVMPGMSGRELADAAQQLRPGLKVLYTSGYTDTAIVHQGRLDPGVHLLSKPYRRAELAGKIRSVLV